MAVAGMKALGMADVVEKLMENVINGIQVVMMGKDESDEESSTERELKDRFPRRCPNCDESIDPDDIEIYKGFSTSASYQCDCGWKMATTKW